MVFAAGNSHFGFPGQHPDLISAGGVVMDEEEKLQASNYASGFISRIYKTGAYPMSQGWWACSLKLRILCSQPSKGPG